MAAIARDLKANELYGEFANLNDVDCSDYSLKNNRLNYKNNKLQPKN